MAKGKGQKFTLADFTNMVESSAPSDSNASWADEEVELPSAPTGATRATVQAMGEHRPGRGPTNAPVDLSRIPDSGPFVVHVGNLPFTVSEPSLRNFFADQGIQTLECRVPMVPGEERRARGFAYVTLPSREAMLRAFETVHGKDLMGRLVRLDVAEQQQRDQGGFQKREWRNMEDRPGRRVVDRSPSRSSASSHPSQFASQWRSESATPSSASVNSTASATSSTFIPANRDWRSAPSNNQPDLRSTAFGPRRENPQIENADRPGRRHVPPPEANRSGPSRRPSNFPSTTTNSEPTFSRDNFGTKLK